MSSEEIIRVFSEYGFTPTEKEVQAVSDTFDQANMILPEQFRLLRKYCDDAFLGILNNALETAEAQNS